MEKENKEKVKLSNEALAIVGTVAIVIVAIVALGDEAKDIALAIGGGLVGYLVPHSGG